MSYFLAHLSTGSDRIKRQKAHIRIRMSSAIKRALIFTIYAKHLNAADGTIVPQVHIYILTFVIFIDIKLRTARCVE